MAYSIALACENAALAPQLAAIAHVWQFQHDPQAHFRLFLTAQGLTLQQHDQPAWGKVSVDFIGGSLAYRGRFSNTRNEAIARAVGIKSNYRPTVLDATAGLGRDAFILAALGCRVQMLERHPVVAALLAEGLQRAYQDPTVGVWLTERLVLRPEPTLAAVSQWSPLPEVIYLDPMFPARHKRALVKKEMQILQQLVGADRDADPLLERARALASRRVVVKRPRCALPLGHQTPQAAIYTQQARFDIYL